ncbi:MAG: PEP-CTERM system TPR-repeat protein PrsT [Desulfuromonadales bacterium]|nr:PEP-CTERM system TPR-repeat protein PrsT [Desulfuromonadales bacterium]
MKVLFVLFTVGFLMACSSQTPQELVAEGDRLKAEGNIRGAIVLYKNALDKDANDLSARLGLALAYRESDSLELAEQEFQKVLLQNPSSYDILLQLAAVAIDRGDPQKGLTEIERFHSAASPNAESLTLQGRAYGASGDLTEAENLFNQAIVLNPTYAPAHLNLAKTYLQRNDISRAEQRLREVIALDERQFEAYFLLAPLVTARGEIESALQLYLDIVAVEPRQHYALYMAGILQLDLGDFAAAEKTVEQLERLFSDRPESYRLKGMLLYRQGDYDDARVALDQSLRTEQHPLTYLFLGLSYYSLERFELALNQFQNALDISPEFERARVLVALTLLKQERVDDAIAQIQRVVSANPNNAYARNILGSALLAAGQLDRGMAELEAATNLDPTMVEAHLQRGAVRLSRGEISAGEEDLIRAVHVSPELLNSRLMLVTHYLRQKNYSAAIDTLSEGMTGTPQDALLNNYLAAAYFSQNRPQQAIVALQAAKEANPDYLTPYFNLASYYASQSDYDQALQQFDDVLSREADNLRALLGSAAIYNVQGRNDDLEAAYRRVEATRTEQGFVATAQYRLRQRDLSAALAVVDRGLQLHVNSAPLLEIKGALHQQQGESGAAEATFVDLAAVAPERGNTLLWRHYMNNNRDQARRLVEDLLRSQSGQEYPYLLAASLHTAAGDTDTATSLLQQGISRLQRPSRLQLQLASIFEQLQQVERAEQLYQRILRSDPTFAPVHVAIGTLAERRGNKGAAREHYQNALSHDRDNVIALNNLAYILADNFGEDRQALDYAMRAYQLRPNDPRIMDTLGYILVKNDRAGDALNLLQQAHNLLPDIPVVAIHLAQAKIALGDKESARTLLEQVRDSTSTEDAATARSMLNQL